MSKYFYRYVNANKWVQINGEGDDSENCKISWESSKDNDDINIIEMNDHGISPLYGRIKFNHPKILNNIHVQVLKISPLIRFGYTCEKYNIPHIEPLLPDPQIIIPEKEDEMAIEKILINKAELSKAINVNSQSGEAGYAFVPRSYDKENRKDEDKLVDDMNKWIRDREKDLKNELKLFYGEL